MMKQPIQFPPSLKKDDKIAVISPAGAVEASQLEKGLEMIESYGFQPVLGNHVYTNYISGYSYAGTEDERISDLHWAFSSPEFAAIWTSRGGYGCQHLLRRIRLSNFKKYPKWYIGYSDNTVIQSYLLKNGFASIHGQTLKTSSFGVTVESYSKIIDILEGKSISYQLEAHPLSKYGFAEGVIVGGNLALIYALMGTSYSFNFKDKILFIEEIGENFYALDRMLISLDLAGVFRKIKGLIVGGMTNMGKEKDNKNYEASYDEFAYEIIHHRLKDYDFPVIFRFPNGHIYDNKPIIIGARATLESNDKPSLSFQYEKEYMDKN